MAEIYKNDVDYMKLLFENENISVYELDAIHLGENPNGMNIDKECAEISLPSFADQPLYCVIDNQWNPLDGEHNDFLEHFREEYPDRITRDRILPFGCVPESAIKDAKFIDRDGKTYLRMNVVVWKNLLPHVSEILQRRDGSVKISVEFKIKKAEQDLDTGIINVKEFQITAITALGENFKEIMDGARIKTVKFSFDDILKNTEKDYFCFSSQESHSVPETVLNTMKNGIILRNKCNRGGTKAIYNSLKTVSDIGCIYDSQIEDFKKYFSSINNIPNEANPPTSKYIVYSMFGGDAGREWINSIVCNGNPDAINKNDEGGSKMEKTATDNNKEPVVPNAEDPNVDSNEGNKEPEDFAKKFSELEDSVKEKDEKFAKMSEDFNSKCAEFDSLKTEKESMDQKFAEMQSSIDSLNSELKEKNDKLAEYEKKENQSKNMAMLDRFKECFNDDELKEFSQMAKELPHDEMNSKMSEKLMSFADNYCSEHRTTDKFAFSVNDMFNVNDYYNQFNASSKQETDLDKIVKKSKTKVV